MSEFLNAMEEALNNVLDVKVGDLVQGEVLTLQDNKQVIVGILGAGVEGVIPAKELSTEPIDRLEEIVKVGDVLDLVVISTIKDKENGSYLLSKRRVDARKIWSEIQEKFENNELVEGTVKNTVKGGLTVDLGVRGFVPASLVSEFFMKDLSQFKGQTLTFKIVECEPSENKLILSRKEVVLAEKAEKMAKALETLEVGSVVEGTVSRLAKFGAFIDLGGVDGLVHISEIAHGHIRKPSDALTVGETVKVKILDITEEGRVSLSIKETVPSPWDIALETFKQGDVVKGIVKRLVDFGAFVELLPGIEGLVHISQISHEHIAVPHEVLQVGQEIDVKIREIQEDEKRISLNIKDLIEKPVKEKEVVEEVVEEEVPYDVTADNTTVTLGDVLGEQLASLENE
ncbi:30S ribosomal protein S1 [Carnobacteriaceae bacterium zg-84]|uniref:30S ribosomal protein S1 n=1 Tax=Granulicatella sp. zg-84 TaxID=2678503 RepID=UPI0013C11487|nr:30S ribosomal protein S1 [Granulicatella sp. zg-84]NEW66448.1 30S ribosomal protein S1 [Granulicatella sp. zg-84]QMI86348.1 30S ribosomal protein S1 [Carnobacteriaceae bacterium zg-84]